MASIVSEIFTVEISPLTAYFNFLNNQLINNINFYGIEFAFELQRIHVVRANMDRRSGEDRRTFNDPNYKGPEQRKGANRRSGEDRRKRKCSNHRRHEKYPRPLILEQELRPENDGIRPDRDPQPATQCSNFSFLS